VPLYHQVYERVRDAIVGAVYGPGAPVPAEREICLMLEVSRITVRKAFERLVQEGLVVRRQGGGTNVADKPLVPAMRGNMESLFENVALIAASTTGRLVELVEAVPEGAVREALHLRRAVKAQRSVHVRLRDGEPLGLIVAWVPLALAHGIGAADIEAMPMISLLAGRGARPAWAQQSIGATAADADQATLLRVSDGAPLVRLTRIVYDLGDRPIEHLTAYYRSDRYEYRTVLRGQAPRRGVAGKRRR